MLEKILVLLDGSILAQAVLPHAHAFAQTFKSETTLLRVLENEEKATHTQVDPVNWHLRKVEANAYLHSVAHDWPPSENPPKLVLEEGTAVDRIVEYVETHELELVILCTHGQTGLSASNLSSVAQKIIHLIPKSFLLVRATNTPPDKDTFQYKRIMVPLDGSRRAECVLPFATKLATTHQAELTLVHVVPKAEMIQRRPLSPEEAQMYATLQERNKSEASLYLRQFAEHEELSASTHLLAEAHVPDALIQFVQDEQIDLVMMCAHGQTGGNSRLYGSLVTNFIHYNSSAALFVVQDLPSEQIKSSQKKSTTTIATGGPNRKIAYAQPEEWIPN